MIPGDGAPSSPQQYRHQQETAQRQRLRMSKSVDGLRQRSQTDPSIHVVRKTFDDIHINTPTLTQEQLNAYGSNQFVPEQSVTSHRKGTQPRHGEESSQANNGSNIYHDQIQHQQQPPLHASQPLPHSSTHSQSPYRSLNVQTTQIASRSSPKLTFVPQTTLQSDHSKGSKETRSFNGSPGQMESKPKSKNSKLKPIVLVENTDEDYVER